MLKKKALQLSKSRNLHFQRHKATSLKTWIFSITAERTSDLVTVSCSTKISLPHLTVAMTLIPEVIQPRCTDQYKTPIPIISQYSIIYPDGSYKTGNVAGGVVSWVYFGFSFFCVNMIICSKVSNCATVVHVPGKLSILFVSTLRFMYGCRKHLKRRS